MELASWKYHSQGMAQSCFGLRFACALENLSHPQWWQLVNDRCSRRDIVACGSQAARVTRACQAVHSDVDTTHSLMSDGLATQGAA